MLMRALSIISRYSRTYFERKLSDIHMGYTEYSILTFVNNRHELNQEQIAKHFQLDKGAVAKALNKLEEKKFITRTDNPSNKREKFIGITDQGSSIVGFLNEELMEWHNYLFEGLSKEEIENFVKTTLKLADNATKIFNERKNDNESAK